MRETRKIRINRPHGWRDVSIEINRQASCNLCEAPGGAIYSTCGSVEYVNPILNHICPSCLKQIYESVQEIHNV